MKISKEILTFGTFGIEKNKFYRHETSFFGKCRNYKYFIGYFDGNHKVKPLHALLKQAHM